MKRMKTMQWQLDAARENWRAILLLCIALCVALAVPTSVTAESAAPVVSAADASPAAAAKKVLTAPVAGERVAAFHEQLLSSMRGNFSFAERAERLDEPVSSLLDIASIARICLGRTWRALSPADQAQFTEELGALITATYADRFDSFNEQEFVTDSAAQARGGVVVKTRLLRQTGEPVSIDYYFRRGKVFNVVADGVSDLSLRRADYNAIIKDQGYAALLDHMQRQRLDLEAADP